MATDRHVIDPKAVAQLERLGEIARRHRDLVAIEAQALDDRAHHEYVWTVRQVDPDTHRACQRYPSLLVLASLTDSLVTFATHLIRDGGLPAIFLLMALESACIPIPAEGTMLFAGFAVVDPSAAHHHLTLLGVVLAGVLGNLVGSWVAYAVGYYGRIELLEKHGRALHVKPSQLAWADRWFERYGSASVFFSRLLPVIRTFISLPAGVARVPLLRFTTLTVAGCAPFVFGLALLGHEVGGRWTKWKTNLGYVDYAVEAAIVVAAAYLLVRWWRRRREPPVADAVA